MAGQTWTYRLPILLVMLWLWWGYRGDPLHSTLFDGITLAFHEAGHAAFMWTGSRFWTVAGGTIFELGIPVAAGSYLLIRQRDPFGALVCLFWLGTALWHTAAYVGDARAQALPLVSPFGPVDAGDHDWTYLLMKFGRLSRDREIAAGLRVLAHVAMMGSMIGGAGVLRVMASQAKAAGGSSEEERLRAFMADRD